jgi:Dynamin family
VGDSTSATARLAECERRLAGAANAPPSLLSAVRTATARYQLPMRVAVVAQIKRGKSTLVNALLGQDIAPTSQLEATFTVGEFFDAPRPEVIVHFTGPAAEPLIVSPEDFRTYTINDPAQAALLRRIRKVEFGLPNPLLKQFRLLDTPGLGSIHQVDSENTLMTLGVEGFLAAEDERRLERVLGEVGRTAADLHADTVQAIDGADAVVYLFDRALNERDASVVVRFLGPLGPSLSALKAIGVLSRCDQWYWPGDKEDAELLTFDPLAVAHRIIRRYLGQPETRRMFFRVLPVAALAAAGTSALDDTRLGWLDELAALEPVQLARLLSDANRFARADEIAGVRLPREVRAELIAGIGAWGTLKAALYRRDGAGPDELRQRLREASGVAEVEQTLVSHFGNRSALLKLDQALRDISDQIARLRQAAASSGSGVPTVVGAVAGILERIRLDDAEMPLLAVLEDYYHGRLELEEKEVDEILRVSGEQGRSVMARLNQPEETPLPELIAAADAGASMWINRSEVWGLDGATAAATRQIGLGYARLSARVRTAQRLLRWDDGPEDQG